MPESMSDEALHARLAEITEHTLSRTSRYGHLAMTTVAAIMAATCGYALWSLYQDDTAGMPPQFAFRAMLSFWFLFVVTCGWAVFGLIVLSRRRPLLRHGELVAAVIALIFSQVFTGGVLGIYMAHHDHPQGTMSMPPLAWLGVATTLVAFVVAVRALLRHSRLQALRERLERELAGG